VTKQK